MSGSSRRFQRRSGMGASGRSGAQHDIVLTFARGMYYSRIWFLSSPAKRMDILAVLRRELPDGVWKFEYRFRYYEDDKAFDSTDRKSFYSAEFAEPLSEAEVASRTSEAIELIAAMQGLSVDTTVIESDDPDVVYAKMIEKPFFQARVDRSGVVQ